MFTIHLFSKPSYMLEQPVTKEALMNLKREVNSNLDEAIEAIDKLTKAGFEHELYAYDIGFSHPSLKTEIEVRNAIAKTGLDPNLFDFDILYEGEADDVIVDECEGCGSIYCPNCGTHLDDEEEDGFASDEMEFGSR